MPVWSVNCVFFFYGSTTSNISYHWKMSSCSRWRMMDVSNGYCMLWPDSHQVCFNVAWKNGWQVISPKKSFAVFAATATEKAEWMAHINKCIVDLLAKS